VNAALALALAPVTGPLVTGWPTSFPYRSYTRNVTVPSSTVFDSVRTKVCRVTGVATLLNRTVVVAPNGCVAVPEGGLERSGRKLTAGRELSPCWSETFASIAASSVVPQ
jgi:hypothetical protein